MITEDYVSFEVAKLLKEKGFDEPTTKSYYTEGFENPMIFSHDLLPCIQTNEFLCPTHQMVMKWLREVHNIFITVSNGNHKDHRDINAPDNVYYFFAITDNKAFYDEDKQCTEEYSTYEQACESAINYCLTNLI